MQRMPENMNQTGMLRDTPSPWDPTNMPLWVATAPLAPETTTLPPGDHRADAVIIGGGFTGLSTALAVAERGVDTVLLEAAEIGWGASGRNNGQIIPCLSRADPDAIVAAFGTERGEALAALIRDSASKVFDLVRRHDIACEAVQHGWVQPAHTPGRVERVSRPRYTQWRRRGAPVELLDRDQVAAITGSRYWHGGWRNPTGGHLNPLAFARGLARAALAAGARVHTRSPALRIERVNEAWRVATDVAGVVARRVVIATNAYSDALWPGLRQTFVAVPSYQIATAPLAADVRRTILPDSHAMSDTHGDLYFCRFDGSGRLVTGGALVSGHDYADRLRVRIGQRLRTIFPQLDEVRFDHVWHGKLSMTEDGLPHVHRLADGVYAWLGCNGRGVALATALGPVFADAVCGVPEASLPVPFVPLAPIAAHRLAERLAPFALLGYRWRDAQG